MSESNHRQLAVLVDADNAQPASMPGVLAEIAKFGTASVKRIYGDWTTPNLAGWKDVVLKHSIQPVQQFRYTVGKNATDSAMIIDAMDLLYTRRFQGFCLVSSDSDFTRLAARVREEGLLALGFGEAKTPKAFVAACDKFIFVEVLREEETKALTNQELPVGKLKLDRKVISLLRAGVEDNSDESGWARLGAVGSRVNKQSPDFDPRNYGHAKLSALFKATDLFEMEDRADVTGHRHIYVRDRRAKAARPSETA